MKVLIIEDDPAIQRALARLLRRQFLVEDIWVSDNATLAIEYLKTGLHGRSFDLILSDWDLIGNKNGGDVLDWLELHASHLVKRFMFISGNPLAEQRNVRSLCKPCDSATLRAAIEALTTTSDS